jgi:hypothetical protein
VNADDQASVISARTGVQVFAGAVLVVSAVFAWMLVMAHNSGAEFAAFTRDPIAVLDGRWYHGFISTLGGVAWVAGGAVALLAGSVLQRSRRADARFLIEAGALTTGLALDDILLFHERWGPRVTGISEKAIEIVWVVLVVLVVVRHWRTCFHKRHIALAMGGFGLLALSSGFDLLLPYSIDFDTRQFIEDVPKFSGIVLWSAFLVWFARASLLNEQIVVVGAGNAGPGSGPGG